MKEDVNLKCAQYFVNIFNTKLAKKKTEKREQI